MKKGLLALAAGLFLTAGSASADWGLIGEFNNWNGDLAMTQTESGVWTVKVESLKGQFKFRENGGWSVNLGADTSGMCNITDNGDFAVRQDGQNFRFTEEVSNVTLTLNTNTNIVTVSGLGGSIVIPDVPAEIYLRGAMNGWGVDPAYKFTHLGGKDYELKVAELVAGEEFKIADADWADVNYSSGVAMEVNTPYVCYYNNSNNMKMSQNVTNAVLKFNLETAELTVVGEGSQVDYTTWYVNVLGDFNDWLDNGVAADAEGIAVLEDLPIGTSSFKVKVWNGVSDVWHSNGQAIAENEWVAIPDNWDANMTIEGATEGQTFTVSFNCATNEIMVKSVSTGVAAIEAANGEAVYFNLQGVRVANPEKGMFIRVQNGKAVKVVK
ncbi:MAG: hypothetical protein K2O24_03875 [Muribaculaceae bacterium]|nr:hypothetical protein [Muribaculaceae bacterium]